MQAVRVFARAPQRSMSTLRTHTRVDFEVGNFLTRCEVWHSARHGAACVALQADVGARFREQRAATRIHARHMLFAAHARPAASTWSHIMHVGAQVVSEPAPQHSDTACCSTQASLQAGRQAARQVARARATAPNKRSATIVVVPPCNL